MVSLPARPNMDQLRHQAKELRRAAVAGNPEALERLGAVSDGVTLATAQVAVARKYGYRSWAVLKSVVDAKAEAGAGALMPGKHRGDGIHGAADALGWAQSQGWTPGQLPIAAILTSQTFITRYLEAFPDRFTSSSELTPTNGRVFLTVTEPVVAIACLGTGASAAVTHLEQLIGLGVKTFICIGPAPAISTALRWGDCVVATAALRDDGISQHYVEPARYAHPDPELTRTLAEHAAAEGLEPVLGPVWTVPTPYRTTAEEVDAYRAEGVLTTDLMTAAVFAVAGALGAKAASASVATSTLGQPRGSAPPPERTSRIFALLEVANRAAIAGSDR
ncbi:MAG TPA: hypothetical protein VM121_06130 [Acidimicrobiales bacterium]|nr:hypothetical protein [Acidimicrobiales bacterium]